MRETYIVRGDKSLQIEWPETDQALIDLFGIERAAEYIRSQLVYHTAASQFDLKKNQGKTALTLDWSGKKLPIPKSGVRQGTPTKEDLELAGKVYAFPDEKLTRWLEMAEKYSPSHGVTLETLDASEDAESDLGQITREIRLELKRLKDEEMKSMSDFA